MKKARKIQIPRPSYTEQDREEISQLVEDLSSRGLKGTEARVYEVISRLAGDNGLSEHAVRYLTGCIMTLLEEEHEQAAYQIGADRAEASPSGTV